MSNREQWDLRGPVESCQIERKWYSVACGGEICEPEERIAVSTVEFLKSGLLARQWHRNPGGSAYEISYEYDDADRLLTAQWADFSHFNEYDPTGRITRIIQRQRSGDERVGETYRYDEAGRKTRRIHVNLEAQSPNTGYACGVEGTDSCYSAQGAATIITVYNLEGKPSELLFEDVEGKTLSQVEFRYDAAGRLVEESHQSSKTPFPAEMLAEMNPEQTEAIKGLFASGRSYRYDERGRRIEASSNFGGLAQSRKTMAYNERGDQIGEVSEETSRDFGMDESGNLSEAPAREITGWSETRFQYEYDDHGNWTRKVVEGRAGESQEFTVSVIEERVIRYFER